MPAIIRNISSCNKQVLQKKKMIHWPSNSFSLSITTFDSPIKHFPTRAEKSLRLRPLLRQLLLCGDFCYCRWCLTKEERVVSVGLTKRWWFNSRATFKVSSFVFILCCNENKFFWKCSSVPLKNNKNNTLKHWFWMKFWSC